MTAAQGRSLDVIGLLDAADAAELYARYKRDYPRSQRLPVQNQVLDALGKRAKKG